MADDQTSQQTRVLLVNGQTIILQGDAGDNSINEINADLLQQALQEVSTTSDDAVEEVNDEFSAPIPDAEDTNDNLVAIFQGDQGETHTIQLTVEQAEALGLHFSVDGDEKPLHHDLPEHSTENKLYISDDQNSQLVYSNNSKHNDSEVMFESELDSNISCADMVQNNRTLENNQHVLESTGELEMLSSSVNTLISEQNQPITLIPQFVDGQMTYTVKIDQDDIQTRSFTNVDSDLKSETDLQSSVGVTLSNIKNFVTTPVPSVCCSASTSSSASYVNSIPISASSVQQSATLPISSVQQSTSLPISSVHQSTSLPVTTIQPSITVPISSVQQTVNLNNYQCSRTSGTNISIDKQTKVSYVILPGTNTNTCSSVSTKLSNTPLGRLSSSFVSSCKNSSLLNHNMVSTNLKSATGLPVVLSTSNKTSSSHTLSGTNSSFTGIPIVSSNTSANSSTNMLAPVGTSTTVSGGMIRVVAGGTTNRTIQPVINNNNNSKFNNILAPTTRLIASNGNITTASKIVSINTSSANKIHTTTTTSEVSNMVSAALTRMPMPNFNSTKPLGSSENPIQLVQHGQTFHSVQSLTQEQLRQIATVLQQQHLEAAPRTKNIVYDAETNTRIIYRVVYPEDLDLRDPRSPDNRGTGLGTSLSTGSSRGRGRRGRPPKSNLRGGLGRGVDGNSGRRVGVGSGSVDMDFDEDRLILDDTAKGERKKQLARTRSGRLSRPPRHMVKDYKRLHHLDFADADLDDSDGGYSDYQMSEHENDESAEKTDSKDLLPGLALPKRKISSHFRCPTCQKIYLGYSRMSRHLEMYPDHGNIEQLHMPNRTNNSNNNNNNDGIEDRLPVSSEPSEIPKLNATVTNTGLNGIVRTGPTGPSRRRGKRRGPWAYTTPEARSQRRKVKLREVLTTCEASELAEVAGPAVAGVLSLWELLLLRVEAVRTEESYVVTLCDELQALLEKVRAVATEILKPLNMDIENNKEHQMEIQDELLCSALGVETGTYLVDDHKFQHISGSRESSDEISAKRMRIDSQDIEEIEEGNTKQGSVVSNHDIINRSNINQDSIGINRNKDCPEVLSALTLVAKSNLEQTSVQEPSFTSARTSGKDGSKEVEGVAKSEDFLLSSESNDMCVKLTSENVRESDNCSTGLQQSDHSSEFANTEQHTQDLQTVDDIVNERLKNLTSGSSLVDFSVAAPMNVVANCLTTSTIDIPKSSLVTSQDLIDRLGQFRPLRLSNDITNNAVSSFDPEMALAAMGEGEQDSVNTSNQHFSSTLQQMETVTNDSASSFDPEVALAAMGEGEQTSVEQQNTQFQQIENVTNSSTFTPEDALAAMGEGEQSSVGEVAHRQFQNTLPQIRRISNNQRTSLDPEMALAAMGEGEQVSNGNSTGSQFQSTLSQIRMDDISDNSGTPFDPEVALAAISDGDRSTVNEVQNLFSTARNVSSNAGNSYATGISLSTIGDSAAGTSKPSQCTENINSVSRFDSQCPDNMTVSRFDREGVSVATFNSQCTENVTVSSFNTQCTENISVARFNSQCTKSVAARFDTQCSDSVTNVSRFDPEMALAAMGEGQTIAASDSPHIPYRSNRSDEANSTFDPEMALAVISEGESIQPSSTSRTSHSDVPIVNSGSFQLQCTSDLGLADTSMDVSLDESGPELDFEALSEEFNRNTRHR